MSLKLPVLGEPRRLANGAIRLRAYRYYDRGEMVVRLTCEVEVGGTRGGVYLKKQSTTINLAETRMPRDTTKGQLKACIEALVDSFCIVNECEAYLSTSPLRTKHGPVKVTTHRRKDR